MSQEQFALESESFGQNHTPSSEPLVIDNGYALEWNTATIAGECSGDESERSDRNSNVSRNAWRIANVNLGKCL